MKKRKNNFKIKKHKPGMLRHFFNKLLLLNTKRVLIILGVWILSVISHDVISAIYKIEEKVFYFISAIIIPLYLLIAIFYFIRTHRCAVK